jgi:glycosyltransferase involved in cell wall biosynthesis
MISDLITAVQRDCPSSTSTGHWVNVISHLDPKYGGISTVVPQLGSWMAANGSTRVELAAFCLPDEHYDIQGHSRLETTYWPSNRMAWMKQRDLRSRFEDTLKGAQGIHIHGLWEQSTCVAARAANRLGKPYILSAHGMLEPWALANKKWKKRIYAALIEREIVAGATCLHALTRAEALNYRGFGSRAPIVVIPNGVNVPSQVDPKLFFDAYPALRGKRIILFLGRMHFKKGLNLLVNAWAELAAKWPDVHLVIAGPDSESTRTTIEQLVRERALVNQVSFTGMLQCEMKWSCLAAAECFVLPSYSEGLSTSVLEAMGIGLPVIITRHCNLPEVTDSGAGWEIEATQEELAQALGKVLKNSPTENQAIGRRGMCLVRDHFNWQAVARRMSEVYRWAATGQRPATSELYEAPDQ